jgi:Glycosyl transferase family 8
MYESDDMAKTKTTNKRESYGVSLLRTVCFIVLLCFLAAAAAVLVESTTLVEHYGDNGIFTFPFHLKNSLATKYETIGDAPVYTDCQGDDLTLCKKAARTHSKRMSGRDSQGGGVAENSIFLAEKDTIRFVLFLCDSKFYVGAVAILTSLSESMGSTTLPPLIMVVGNVTLQPVQLKILESLGAEVKLITIPKGLDHAARGVTTLLGERWQGVFSKMLLFRPNIVECDLVFYIDLDALARGNLITCMNETIEAFRSNPKLDFLASGDRYYFNNGVMLARPRKKTYRYMVQMLKNGTCMGRICNGTTTMMSRIVYTDQDIFIEYSQRFPDRFYPISGQSSFNLRPTYNPIDRDQDCSIIHYTGDTKPWSALFPGQDVTRVGIELPRLANSVPIPTDAAAPSLTRKMPIAPWALEVWRANWNRAVTQIHTMSAD